MLSSLVKCCEDIWNQDIRFQHPELPDAVFVVGSGGRSAANKLGHFCSKSWSYKDNTIHEVLLVAEQLNRPAQDIFQTIVHESVHAMNDLKEIKDVSGKRHNKKFAAMCSRMGLEPPAKPSKALGFSEALLTPESKQTYSKVIDRLAAELKLVRLMKPKDLITKPSSFKLVCNCMTEHPIRVGAKFIKEDWTAMCPDCNYKYEIQDA